MKIRLRIIDPKIKKDQSDILDAVNKACNKVDVLNIYATTDGAVLKMQSLDSIHGLLTPEAKESLKGNNLKPMTPQWLNPAKTIFLHRLPAAIVDRDNKTIKEEIINSNTGVEVEFACVIRSMKSNKRFIKLVLGSPETADNISKKGLRLFNYIVTPETIAQHWQKGLPEIDQCYKCYSFDHKTNQCTAKAIACSICNGPHHYKVCEIETPCCINCKGSHHSASKECPVRKRRTEDKRKAIENEKKKPKNQERHTMQEAPTPSYNPWQKELPTDVQSQLHNESSATTQVEIGLNSLAASHTQIISKFAEMLANDQGNAHVYFEITRKMLEYNGLPTVDLPPELAPQVIMENFERIRREREEKEYLLEEEHRNRLLAMRNNNLEHNNHEENLENPGKDERKVNSVLGKAPPIDLNKEHEELMKNANHIQKEEEEKEKQRQPTSHHMPPAAPVAPQKGLRGTRDLKTWYPTKEENENQLTQDSFKDEFLMKQPTKNLPTILEDELSSTTDEEVNIDEEDEINKEDNESGNQEAELEDNDDNASTCTERSITTRSRRNLTNLESESESEKEENTSKQQEKQKGKRRKRTPTLNKEAFLVTKTEQKKKSNRNK